jgi:hypothetical protein
MWQVSTGQVGLHDMAVPLSLLQASMSSEGVKAWSGLLAELQAVTGAAPAGLADAGEQ